MSVLSDLGGAFYRRDAEVAEVTQSLGSSFGEATADKCDFLIYECF